MIKRVLPGVVATIVALSLGGCGSAPRTTRTRVTEPRPALAGSGEHLFDGRRGGTLIVYEPPELTTLDPGEVYDTYGEAVTIATQRPLFSYLPNQTEALAPDLAARPAIVSRDGRTVTVDLRPEVHFSPPVNREVTSADVAYAIERGANPNVANPYFSAYYDYIIGARQATGGPIPGIATPDKYTIVFHLTGPYGTLFADALSLPLTAPVPREFAGPLDQHKPTQYGSSYLAATGPYMIQTDAGGRFLGTGYKPGQSATLVRNPRWNPATDRRPAYLDRIDIAIGGDPNVIGRQVLLGSHSVEQGPTSAPIVKLAYEHHHEQLVAVPGAGLYYVALDNKHGPFRSSALRKALWAALDRRAMINAGGGPITGQLATHFIYPGTEGYAQAGGDPGPSADYNRFPSGNMTVAARYIRAAGYPSGRYRGAARISVVGAASQPYASVAEIVNQTLLNLGFRTKLALFDQSVMLSKFCQIPAREVDVCPNVGWVRDFADPETILDPTFAGYNIAATATSNFGQVDDPDINAGMRAAERLVDPAARARAWARIDRTLVATAAAIPWEFIKNPLIRAPDVRGINDLWNAGFWDYSYASLD
jgi:peptide/nickel transport system substrate-binding protein